MCAAEAWTSLLNGFKFYTCVLKKHLLTFGVNLCGTVSFLSYTRGSQGLSSVTRQTRQQRDMLWPPPPPKPSSDIMIKTKAQWFTREVWELFPVNIWKLSVPVPSTMLLPIIASIGMSWFKPYGIYPEGSDTVRLEGNSVLTCVFA